MSASADGRSSRPTRAGTDADRAGLSIADIAALAPLNTKIIHTIGASSEAFTANPTAVSIRPIWAATSSLRRSIESTIAPPTNEVASSGTSCAIPSVPTSSVDPVSS